MSDEKSLSLIKVISIIKIDLYKGRKYIRLNLLIQLEVSFENT